ncbi:glycosyltransferase family 92 protein [soil metagenome]
MFSEAIGRLWKIGKLGIRAPVPEPGRHGLAVVLIARNEAARIGEWAGFHLAAGARHLYVYDNGSSDATLPVLRGAVPFERLTVTPWRQLLSEHRTGREIHNQVLAYAHAAGNFGGAYRWMAFIDVDEFLVPTGAPSLDGALAHLGPDVRFVSLPWHMFGRSGHAAAPAGGVVRNYLLRAADPMSGVRGVRQFKCLADPCHLTAVRVHSMEVDGHSDTWNDRGKRVPLARRGRPEFYSVEHLQLNHYYTGSEQELAAKIGRGPNLAGKRPAYRRKVLRTVRNIESAVVEDRAALDFLRRAGGSEAG